ncbi:unnamed protein product [Protopolystoma xenopodis]|uniref:Uncharacterized protein n=1 Tax=Protopolystoma xenopodis TaxID=117903 RepID=A0A448X0H0_9PLAT|nr:unnamed protein product [Protopolystoma xenopodis]
MFIGFTDKDNMELGYVLGPFQTMRSQQIETKMPSTESLLLDGNIGIGQLVQPNVGYLNVRLLDAHRKLGMHGEHLCNTVNSSLSFRVRMLGEEVRGWESLSLNQRRYVWFGW